MENNKTLRPSARVDRISQIFVLNDFEVFLFFPIPQCHTGGGGRICVLYVWPVSQLDTEGGGGEKKGGGDCSRGPRELLSTD